MISAREALTSIERALQGVRKDEDRLLTMLASSESEAERVRAGQAEAFRALARLRLDALARDEAVGRLDSAERRAMEALSRRRQALDHAARRRGDLTSSADAIEERREAAAAARDAAVAAIEDLTEQIEAVAAKDSAWQSADAAAREAEDKAVGAEEKARQAAEDREAKGKPYEADPLFMYLWSRGYGTSAYRAGPIVRYFDAKVARLIRFSDARANYFMLNEIPVRLAQHAERQRSAVAEAEEQREAVERAALEAAGIDALEADLEAREAELEAAMEDLETVRAALGGIDAETRGLLDETADPGIKAAVDDLATAFSRDDLRSLYREALDTPTPEDEAIVKSLQEAERRLVRITAQMEEVRAAAVDLARKRTELERSEQNFRKSGYDNPYGEFVNGAIIGGIIQGIIRGAMSSRNLDDALGKEYRKRTPRSSGGSSGGFGGGFGGGVRMPKGRGGFRTGGRSGGGGFRTGGSF